MCPVDGRSNATILTFLLLNLPLYNHKNINLQTSGRTLTLILIDVSSDTSRETKHLSRK